MAKFKVVTSILKDGKRFEPGEVIELAPKEAAGMPWAVEAAKEEKKEAPKQ